MGGFVEVVVYGFGKLWGEWGKKGVVPGKLDPPL